QVADALAGDSQRLRPRGRDDGTRDEWWHFRHHHVVEHERAIGLVADQRDGPADSLHQRLDLGERRRRIDHAARIVRRVDEDRARLRRDGRLQPRDIGREVGLRLYYHAPPAV